MIRSDSYELQPERNTVLNQNQWNSRAEKSTDIGAIRDITLAAFATAEEAELVDALRQDSSWIEELSVVTTDDRDHPLGYALLTRCHIDETPALCLGPCAVIPEFQGSGVGSAAIRFALEAAAELGERFVVVLGHPTYYPRFGFNRASLAGIRLSIDVPDDALMVLSLNDAHDLPSGQVKYAAPFGI